MLDPVSPPKSFLKQQKRKFTFAPPQPFAALSKNSGHWDPPAMLPVYSRDK